MSSADRSQYKCGGCEKMRNAQRFSATAIKKYEAALAASRRSKKPQQQYVRLPLCSNCNGQPNHEYDCAKCGLTKSADAFSGQQRKRGDNKECKDCVQEREDREANFGDEVREQIIMEELRNGSAIGYEPSHNSVTGASHPSRMPNSRGLSSNGDLDDDDSAWAQPPVPIPADPRANTSDDGISGRIRRLSFGSDNTHHSSNTNPSAVAGTAWDRFDQTYAPYREHTRGQAQSEVSVVSRGSNPGFVRQGAVKQDPREKATVQLERQRKREQEQAEQAAYRDSDSDNDDDSDDDDPY